MAGPVRLALGLGTLVVLLAACGSLPRTAAMQSEILRETRSEERDLAVVPVTRAGLAAIAQWPGPAPDRWLPRSAGPDSPVIRPGDRITLTVWDNDPNSLLTPEGQKQVRIEALPVSPQGAIFVPYLEEVVVNGQTPDQARRQIQARLDDILPSAQVQLELNAGRRSSVDLLGGVARPGRSKAGRGPPPPAVAARLHQHVGPVVLKRAAQRHVALREDRGQHGMIRDAPPAF